MTYTAHIRVDKPISRDLSNNGFSLVAAKDFLLSSEIQESADRLWNSWNWLEPDRYLQSSNVFRYRRYGLFQIASETGIPIPQKQTTYFQSAENNSYAGGIMREFCPLQPDVFGNIFLHALITHDFHQIRAEYSYGCKCLVGVHQMRVVAAEGYCGEPTPEGIHRDGHDFNVIHFVARKNVMGGQSRIYSNNKSLLVSSLLRSTLDSIYLDDRRVLHDVSPIFQEIPGVNGYRDVMTINFEFS